MSHRREILLFGGLMLTMVQAAPARTIRVPQDKPTIQAAIDAATAGDRVLVAAGTYHERLQMKAGVTVRSAGDDSPGKLGLRRAESTIINGARAKVQGPGVMMAEGATLDGFTVTGIGEYDDALWKQHFASLGNDQSREHIGAPGNAGIAVSGIASCSVLHNIVHHIGHTGIAITGAKGITVRPHIAHNVAFRNMGGGIGSMRGSQAVIEHNICFENFYAGIGNDGASPTVVHNTCYGNIRAGIGISKGSCPIVRDNKCYRNRRAGIGIRTGADTRPTVEDNECYENGMAGIGVEEHAAPLIRNNRCYRNKLAGIGVRSHASPMIIGNECYENTQAGIGQRDNARTILVGNFCHHNKAAGLGFEACRDGRATVANNRVIENGLVAVGIHSGWTVELVGNELSRRAGLPPIVMIFDKATVRLSGNVIRGSGVAAVRVAGAARLENNTLDGFALRKNGPPNFAVWVLDGANVTMIDNKVRRWRHAMVASHAKVAVVNNTVRDFHRSAIVIQEPTAPADAYGNTAYSNDQQAKVVAIDGPQGNVRNNRKLPVQNDR